MWENIDQTSQYDEKKFQNDLVQTKRKHKRTQQKISMNLQKIKLPSNQKYGQNDGKTIHNNPGWKTERKQVENLVKFLGELRVIEED